MAAAVVSLASKLAKSATIRRSAPLVIDCEDVAEFIEGLEETEDWHSRWFRGLPGPLANTPKIFRDVEISHDCGKKFNELMEGRIINGISRKLTFFSKEIDSVVDALCLAQHLGFPTRLLDFSENLGTAVYFATPHPQARPHIWALNPVALNALLVLTKKAKTKLADAASITSADVAACAEDNGVSIFGVGDNFPLSDVDADQWLVGVSERIEEIEEVNMDADSASDCLPMAFFPTYINRRLLLQQASFLLFGAMTTSLEEVLSHFSQDVMDLVLRCYKFSDEFCENSLYSLREICPSPTQIFGDEQGLFQELLDNEIWAG